MIETIRQLISILDLTTKRRFLLLILPMGITTGLELLSVAMVLPVIQFLVIGGDGIGASTKINSLIQSFNFQELGYLAAMIFLTVFVIKNFLMVFTLYIINLVINLSVARYTKKVFEVYLARPMKFHYKNNSGYLLRDLISGVSMTMNTARALLVIVFDVLVIITIFSLLLYIDTWITVISALLFGTVSLAYYRVFGPIFQSWGEQSQSLEGQRNKWVLASFSGIKDVKITNSYKYLANIIYNISINFARVSAKSNTVIYVPRLLLECFLVFGFLVLIYSLTLLGYSKNEMIVIVGVFGMGSLRIIPSLNRLLSSVSEVSRLSPYVKTIRDSLRVPDEEKIIVDERGGLGPLNFSQKIELKELVFSYDDEEAPVINRVNLTIERGKSVGIVGPSGCGKSTLLEIIIGLLEPSSGVVLADDREIRDNLPSWSKKFGLVPQELCVFDDSLRRNVAFGVSDPEVDDEQIIKVLRLANLADLVHSLPDGLDTNLGESGSLLSGGQRQRLVLARSLYRDPEILVLDEATSALDHKNESQISHMLKNLSGNTTIIFIAHKISTIRNFDKIVVMDAGKIVSTGTYSELVKESSHFRSLISDFTLSDKKQR